MIKLQNIRFRYRNTNSTGEMQHSCGVEGVNLSIEPGEFVVLAGNSGCGKTTVTRLINGLVPHYYEGDLEGQAHVCGLDVGSTKISDLATHVGSVFQNPRSQFFNVDTTSELAFASENQCVAPEQIRRDIARVADEMKLEPLMDRSIFALSGGEKQKIACASVAVAQPETIVLDEPSSNLDAAGIEDLRGVLGIWKAAGKTVVVAEHRLYYLIGLADRLILMQDGRITEELNAAQLAAMTNEDAYARGLRAFTHVPHKRKAVSVLPDCALVCKDFSFHYKNSDRGIQFDEHAFPAKSITAIMGRNGAGKSTFARVLCGLERKGQSTVLFDGKSYSPKERTKLCYMILQDVNHQLFTESVLEEVVLSAPANLSGEEARARAQRILEQLDLASLADTHPAALSGGQKQRVAIASGVMAQDPVLIFDEPTSGLDLHHMKQVAALLRALRDGGKVVIVITHDTELVHEVADQVIWFS